MHKKPTDPFGYIAFPKDGKVSKHIARLPDSKPEQERGAFERFIDAYNKANADSSISNVRQLPEADHDFLVDIEGTPTWVQLAELHERTYSRLLTDEERDSCKWHETISKGPSVSWGVDPEKRDNALKALIASKVEKHYAPVPTGRLWLVVFSTSAFYQTEYVTGGKACVSESLQRARDYLELLPVSVFDAVWFTNMITVPVRIWRRR